MSRGEKLSLSEREIKNELEQFEEQRKNIKKRDFLQKLAGFYKTHSNTIKIDVTECKTVEESTDKVLENIRFEVEGDKSGVC